jgi:hypothetical protein
MKKKVFLAAALLALMAAGVYAQTEADFEVYSDGKSITITKYKGSATAVTIPEKINNLPVTLIGGSEASDMGGGVFEGNDKITSVTIPYSTKFITIGPRTFAKCTNLTSITIPDNVNGIGMSAFDGCTNLASVTLGSRVSTVGDNAFRGCTSLTRITFGSTMKVNNFSNAALNGLGNIWGLYMASSGGKGTYTRPDGGKTWTKQSN